MIPVAGQIFGVIQRRERGVLSRASTWSRPVGRMLADFAARRRQRQALAALDARLLRDIGLTPEQARQEGAKPFWRA